MTLLVSFKTDCLRWFSLLEGAFITDWEELCTHPRQVNRVCEHHMQHEGIETRNLIPALEMLKSLSDASDVLCNLLFIVPDFTIFPETFGNFHILCWFPLELRTHFVSLIYLPHFAWQTLWLLHHANHILHMHKAHFEGVWQKWTGRPRLVNGYKRSIDLNGAQPHFSPWPALSIHAVSLSLTGILMQSPVLKS